MIAIRKEDEIAILREADALVADVLAELADLVVPGVTTGHLEDAAAAMIRDAGAVPAFLGYHGYPACTCISVDDVVVHGIPGDRVLREGQIVSMDVGVRWKGYYGDAALTAPCGQIDATRQLLMETTERSLEAAIAAAVEGNYLQDIGRAVQDVCEAEGFSVVRSFVGHGIGTRMHEDPQIPNFDSGERGPQLRAGMVLAIEPMVNAGTHEVKVLDDGWTAVTADGRPSAHFEHSIVVGKKSAEVLSVSPRRSWAMGAAAISAHTEQES